jgi:hypothetical protein
MPTHTYRLKINRQGYEFEVEGDKAFVMEMLQRFEPSQETKSGPPATEQVKTKTKTKQGTKDQAVRPIESAKSLSIREFVQTLGFKKHTDLTVAFGYYLEKHLGASEFTSADINTCYYDAKLDSSNTSQMISRNIKRGYIMEKKGASEKKTLYTLTQSGEHFIKSKISPDASQA